MEVHLNREHDLKFGCTAEGYEEWFGFSIEHCPLLEFANEI